MTMDVLSRDAFAHEVGLLDAQGGVSPRAIAGLLRAPLARWGLSPRGAVMAHARDQLRAAGLEDSSPLVARVLDRLLVFGECEEVCIEQERYLAPAQPRWLQISDTAAAWLSPSSPPEEVEVSPPVGDEDLVRRFRVDTEEVVAQLHLSGAAQLSLKEWLQPLDYARHAQRRLRRTIRLDDYSLAQFWELLNTALINDGLQLGDDAEVRALIGSPGEYFGRHDAADLEGRWTDRPEEGVWCAYRRGFGERHWHPALVAVSGEHRRCLDLFDHDEWRWALLARGRSCSADELVPACEGVLRLSFPPPSQLAAAMDLIGGRTGPWTWAWPDDAPALWSLVG